MIFFKVVFGKFCFQKSRSSHQRFSKDSCPCPGLGWTQDLWNRFGCSTLFYMQLCCPLTNFGPVLFQSDGLVMLGTASFIEHVLDSFFSFGRQKCMGICLGGPSIVRLKQPLQEIRNKAKMHKK